MLTKKCFVRLRKAETLEARRSKFKRRGWKKMSVVLAKLNSFPTTQYAKSPLVSFLWNKDHTPVNVICTLCSDRQGNMHNHLANFLKATKISGIAHIDALYLLWLFYCWVCCVKEKILLLFYYSYSLLLQCSLRWRWSATPSLTLWTTRCFEFHSWTRALWWSIRCISIKWVKIHKIHLSLLLCPQVSIYLTTFFRWGCL